MEGTLIDLFAQLNDAALLARLQSGALTEQAQSIAMCEAARRGLELPIKAEEPEDTVEIEADAPADDRLEQLIRFLRPMEATTLGDVLRQEGIEPHLSGLNTLQTQPLWHVAMNGVRILVRQSQYEQARAVLSAWQNGDYALDDDEFGPAPLHSTPKAHPMFWVALTFWAYVFSAMLLQIIWALPASIQRWQPEKSFGEILFQLLLTLFVLALPFFSTRHTWRICRHPR